MPARDFESPPWLIPLFSLVGFGIVFAYMAATEALLPVRAPSAEHASADALNAGAADVVASSAPAPRPPAPELQLPPYRDRDIVVSFRVNEFYKDESAMNLAIAAKANHAISRLGARVGSSRAGDVAEDIKLFNDEGCIVCEAEVVAKSISFNDDTLTVVAVVQPKAIVFSCPDVQSSQVIRAVASRYEKMDGVEYTASIELAPNGSDWIIQSHSHDGQPLTEDNVKRIIRQNSAVLLSLNLPVIVKEEAVRAVTR